MVSFLVLLTTIVVSSVYGFEYSFDCPQSQTDDSHSVCNIFQNTNIEMVIPQNFDDDNYCDWNYQSTLISCQSKDDDSIEIIELQYQDGLNGTLDFNYSWPSDLIELDLEQSGIVHLSFIVGMKAIKKQNK